MTPRAIRPRILQALQDAPVLFIAGPRQSGKTTLVQDLAQADFPARYFTLDDPAPLAAASADPHGFIEAFDTPVIIDEVQRAPGLFRAIKATVDRHCTPGRFLLTGSANVRVLPELSDALVGRVDLITLWPFSQSEIEGRPEAFVDTLFSRAKLVGNPTDVDRRDLIHRIVRGGYPEAVTRTSDARRDAWFRSYVATIVQRDVRDMADIEGLAELPRLLGLLAARAANLLNISELSRDSGIALTTLRRYLSLLEATFLFQLLPPWSGNIGQRLVKSPKVLMCDTGLACSLLGAETARFEEDPTLLGPLLENFIAMELRKQISFTDRDIKLLTYRSYNRQEVDIVLEDAGGRLVAIEIKATVTVRDRDLRGLRAFAAAVGDRFHRGILLCRARDPVPFGDRIQTLPITALWAQAK